MQVERIRLSELKALCKDYFFTRGASKADKRKYAYRRPEGIYLLVQKLADNADINTYSAYRHNPAQKGMDYIQAFDSWEDALRWVKSDVLTPVTATVKILLDVVERLRKENSLGVQLQPELWRDLYGFLKGITGHSDPEAIRMEVYRMRTMLETDGRQCVGTRFGDSLQYIVEYLIPERM